MSSASTPAALSKAQKAALEKPPVPPKHHGHGTLRRLTMVVEGVTYRLGRAIEGDPQMDATKDGAATITMTVRDHNETLQSALTEDTLLQGAATVTVDGIVYVVDNVEGDDTALVTVTLQDQVAWRLQQYSKPISAKRSKVTRAEFVAGMVDEASAPPMAPMNFFCPEIDDKQRIAAIPKTGASS